MPKRTLIAGIISIIYIFIIIFVAEIYLRQKTNYIAKAKSKSFLESGNNIDMYTHRGKRLIPNLQTVIRNHYLSGHDIQIDINSLGFRDDEISKDKENNELRILVLGDSITFGSWLKREEVYVERIEKYLNEFIKTRTINVINAGVSDVGLEEEIDILMDSGLVIDPDIVIVAFYLNDSRPPWGFSREYGGRSWLRKHSFLAEKLYYKLNLWRWIKNKGEDRFQWIYKQHTLDWVNNKEDFLKLTSLAKYDWGAAWQTDSWNIIDKELNKLKLLSKQYNFDVAIIVFPVSFQIYADFIEDFPQRILKEKITALGFYYFDLLPLLKKYKNEDIYYDQAHLKKNANDIIGKAVANFIKDEMLFELE